MAVISLITKLPFVKLVKLPVDAAVAVVVPNINLSSDSSQPIKALSPVVPLSIIIPQSFELAPVVPLFNPIIESVMVVFAVVSPVKVK